MKIDTRDKKPKVFSIAAISVIAAVLFAVFALCSGGRASLCISVLLCVYLAAAAGILIGSFIRQVQYNPYSYNTIYYAGFALFDLAVLVMNVFCLARIAERVEYYSPVDLVSVLANSAKIFIYYTFPLTVCFAAALALSNVILIRREGFGLVNVLGILFACLLVGGALIIGALDLYPFVSAAAVRTADLLTALFGAVYLYVECMLIGAVVACLLVVQHDPPFDRDFLIVLGCGLRADGTPTPLLRGRLDRALDFWREQRSAAGFGPVLVTSGGQGPDEVVSESAAMKRYLMEQGVPEDQILEEDQSTDTFENMKFSRAKILERMKMASVCGPRETLPAKIGFSTTNYHEFRSGIYARRVKMRAEGICAPTKWYFWPNAWVRELIGVLAEHRGKQSLVLGGMIVFYVALGMWLA